MGPRKEKGENKRKRAYGADGSNIDRCECYLLCICSEVTTAGLAGTLLGASQQSTPDHSFPLQYTNLSFNSVLLHLVCSFDLLLPSVTMKTAWLSYSILPAMAVMAVTAVRNLPGCTSTDLVSTSWINVAGTISLDPVTVISNTKNAAPFPNSSTTVYQLPSELQPPFTISNLESFPTFRQDPTGFSPTTIANFTGSFSTISRNSTRCSKSIQQHNTGTGLATVCPFALSRFDTNIISTLRPSKETIPHLRRSLAQALLTWCFQLPGPAISTDDSRT